MAGRPYGTKEYADIIQLWKDGKSTQEIADKYGRTKGAIRNLLSVHRREEDPTLRQEKKHETQWTTSVCRKFADMWNAGATHEEIAEAFGLSVSTIKWRATCIRKAYGVQFLPYRREFAVDRG